MGRNQNDETLNISKGIKFDSNGFNTQANGSNNVTISNVAPAGVTTDTISAWLKITLDSTEYYIPLWT